MRQTVAVRVLRGLFAVAGAASISMLLPAGMASAHTALDFTVPAEGTTVAEPVKEISVGFTDVVALVGNGFEVLDPQGNLVVPFAVTDDDKVFRLQLDPPLAGGPVVVTYHVLSLDGHEVQGQVSFTAAAEPPPATTAPPSTIPVTAPTTPTTVTPTTAPPTIAPPTAIPTAPEASITSATAAIETVSDVSDEPSGDGDDSTGTWLIVGLVAVVIASLAFVAVRSRRAD